MTENGNGKAVAQLSDDLIAKARAIASRSDELLELLEDARQRLLDSEPGKEKVRRSAPKRRFKPGTDPKPKAAPKAKAKSENEISDGLRLLTSQMAADGAGRQEIAKCLREDFAIENPEPILKSMGL
jgi:hypothetical protein